MSFRPLLIVIGGPNGAGKTTLSSYLIDRVILNLALTPLINPDEIALTLSGQESGYEIIGYYVSLINVQDSIFRVADRVNKGGHNVPRKNLLIRYGRSLQNLAENFKKFDRLYLLDNSSRVRSRIAIIDKGVLNWLNRKHINHPLVNRLNLAE